MAYTKLIAVRTNFYQEDEDSDDESDSREEDVNEMRAFMNMFMDLVGIFHEDQNPIMDCKNGDGKITAFSFYSYSLLFIIYWGNHFRYIFWYDVWTSVGYW